MEKTKLIDDLSSFSDGDWWLIGIMGFLRTLDEKIDSERIWRNSRTLCIIGILALNGYDIYTKEFVEFWRGSYNGLPECSLYYRYVGESIEIKAVKIKERL